MDVRLQVSNSHGGKDLAGHYPAIRCCRTRCERAKRTVSSSTQATIEIDTLLDGTDCPLAFNELNMDYLRNSKRPIERCLCDGGIEKRSVHDVVHVRGATRISTEQKVIQEFPNGKEPNRPINPFSGGAVQAAISTGKRSSQVQDLAENHRDKRHLGTQCERAKRTLSSSTQEEIDFLFDDADSVRGVEHELLPQLQQSR